jgi:integrase
MPAIQNGTVFQRSGSKRWTAKWFDHEGTPRTRNFDTKSDGRAFLNAELIRVEQAKSGKRAVDRPGTVADLVERFLASWGRGVDPTTLVNMMSALGQLSERFGLHAPEALTMESLTDWRYSLSPGVQHDVFRRARQMFKWAVLAKLIDEDPTTGIKNPVRPKHERKPINVFGSWAEVERVAAELLPRLRAIPIIMADTGLRPEELFGLHRSDVDWERMEFTVRRRFTAGLLKEGLKRKGESERRVPFTARTLAALKALPPRLDTQILVSTKRGSYIDSSNFRNQHWYRALRAAGVGHHTLYDLRHTWISWALAAGVPPAKVALLGGTSIKMLDATYSHLIPSDFDEYRERMARFEASQPVAR